MEGVTDCDSLTTAKLCKYLEEESRETKEVVNINRLDDIVAQELRTNMSDSNIKYTIRNLLVSLHSILKRLGLG